MTAPRRPLLCAVADCIEPRLGAGDVCMHHLRLWHRDGWAERAFKSDHDKVRAAFLAGDKAPPERILAVVP